MIAAKKLKLNVVKILLEAGARLDYPDLHASSPLLCAINGCLRSELGGERGNGHGVCQGAGGGRCFPHSHQHQVPVELHAPQCDKRTAQGL